MPPSATPAIELVRRSGVPHQIRTYEAPERHGRDRDERPDYGLEAAAALGVDPGRVCKTLVATVDGRLVAAVLPVDRQLDLKALAVARRLPYPPTPNGRAARSSAASARSRPAGAGRWSSRRPPWPTRRSCAAPVAAASSWSSTRPISCV